jgi:beta-mannanase
VCDPDVSQVEGRSTGFLYTMISRATTFGDEMGRNSAIYFTGPHLTKERIQRLTLRSDNNKTLANVQRRTDWVEHLQRNTVDTSKITPEEIEDVFRWATTTTYTYDELYRRTQEYITSRHKTHYAFVYPS